MHVTCTQHATRLTRISTLAMNHVFLALRRAIYTRKALDASVFFSDTLIGVHTFAVEQMASNVSQVTGLGIIIVSAVVGLGLLLSLLRTFQETASLPSTKCGESQPFPGCCAKTACAHIGIHTHIVMNVGHGPWAMGACSACKPGCTIKDSKHDSPNPSLHAHATGAPGKVSYGFYVTLISVITFALWLMSIVVALLIAAQLCWLLLAFMFQSALAHGVA